MQLVKNVVLGNGADNSVSTNRQGNGQRQGQFGKSHLHTHKAYSVTNINTTDAFRNHHNEIYLEIFTSGSFTMTSTVLSVGMATVSSNSFSMFLALLTVIPAIKATPGMYLASLGGHR